MFLNFGIFSRTEVCGNTEKSAGILTSLVGENTNGGFDSNLNANGNFGSGGKNFGSLKNFGRKNFGRKNFGRKNTGSGALNGGFGRNGPKNSGAVGGLNASGVGGNGKPNGGRLNANAQPRYGSYQSSPLNAGYIKS